MSTPTPEEVEQGLEALRAALKRMRWDDQGGYVGYLGEGKWIGIGSPQVRTATELNALFKLAGIEPDRIVTKGHCEDCKHAEPCVRPGGFITYHERGYAPPCSPCKRPQMSNFEPRLKFPKMHRYWCMFCGDLFEQSLLRDKHLKTCKHAGR
jgi:hypothetical protein